MTIQIQQDAILCVTNSDSNNGSTQPSCHQHNPLRKETLPYSLTKDYDVYDYSDMVDSMIDVDSQSQPELDETDDDDSTLSSCSSSSKGVTFCDNLVTEVNWRPRTRRKDVRSLFYTVEETQRFRQEYREERRLKAQEGADSSSLSKSGELGLDNSDRDGFQDQEIEKKLKIHPHFRISRVVILHKNNRETFIDGKLSVSHSSSPSSSSSRKGNSSSTMCNPCPEKSDSDGNAFFDNDSFWSGQLTWY